MSSLIVKGPNLMLTPYEEGHADKMFEWFYGPEYQFFFRDDSQVLNPNDFKEFNQMAVECFNRLTLVENKSNEFIGHMTFNLIKKKAKVYNFGILIDKKFRRKAYCLEGSVLMMELLFRRLDAHKMVCEVLAEDQHLNRIIKVAGFTQEGSFKEEPFLKDRYYDENYYSIFKEQFEEYYGDFVKTGVMKKPQVS